MTKDLTGSRHTRHADISHSMGVILKKVYEKQSDFVEFTTLLGKKRLQYHLTDKAYSLPPNMRAISRFMNMSSWVFWGNEMLHCYDTLPKKMQEAYAFIKDYESLLKELQAVLCAVRHVEAICKKSPNKLYGVTSFVLTIPLHPKVSNESVTKTINFKDRIVNVKLKDISTWSTEHLSKNRVTERTKTLRKVS